MGSAIRIKTFARRLALLSAGLLVQSNTLFAAGIAADGQLQARDLLTGTVDGRPRVVDRSPATPSDGPQASAVDPQEQARRLILGQPRAGSIADKTAASAESHRGHGYGDPQELAQRMILGAGASGGATSVLHKSVSLTHAPLVMRLNKGASAWELRRIAWGG
jgi:hypothetical protein